MHSVLLPTLSTDLRMRKPVDVITDELGNRFSKVQFCILGERLDSQLLQILLSQLRLFGLDGLHERVVIGISSSPFLLSVDCVFNVFHLLLTFFLLQFAVIVNRLNFSLSFSFDLH